MVYAFKTTADEKENGGQTFLHLHLSSFFFLTAGGEAIAEAVWWGDKGFSSARG